jgi:hypothetical protein
MLKRSTLPLIAVSLLVAGAGRAPELYSLTSQSYKLTTDVDRELARDICRHMDAVSAEYARIFAAIPSRRAKSYPLYVFKRQSDYMSFLDDNGVDGAGSGGMFFDRWLSSALTTYIGEREIARVYHILRHEGFHQFARSKFGTNLPAWANEGLAEYFGEAIVAGGRLLVGQVPATRLARMQAAIREDQQLPLETLMNMSKSEWNDRLRAGESKMQYQQAWMLVHFFFHDGSPYRSQFESYLHAIADGYSSRDAFARGFGTTDYGRFEEPFKQYVLNLQPNPEKAAAQRLEFLAAGLKYLYTRDRVFSSLEDLKKQLRSVGPKGYWLRFNVGYDQSYEMRASDEDNFRAPRSDDGHDSKLEFIAAEDGQLPPSIAIRGLACTLRLEWQRQADTLVSRIVYEASAAEEVSAASPAN